MPVRLVLAVVAGVVLVAAVVTTAVHGSPSHPHPTPASLHTTTSTTTTLPADPDLSGVVRPPLTGFYRYREEFGASVAEWGEQISVVSSSASATTLRILTSTGTSETVEYSPTAEWETGFSQSGTTVEDEIRCDDQPPVLLLRLPLAIGTSWSSTADCTNLLGSTVTLTRKTRVVGHTTLTVAGQAVPVWELVSVLRQEGAAGTSEVTTTIDVSARLGLLVRVVTQQGTDPHTLRTARIVSLQPA